MNQKLLLPFLGLLTVSTACLPLNEETVPNEDPPISDDITSEEDATVTDDTAVVDDTSTTDETTTEEVTTPTASTAIQFMMPISVTAAFKDGKTGSWEMVSETSSTASSKTFDMNVTDVDGNYSMAFAAPSGGIVYNLNTSDLTTLDFVGATGATRNVDVTNTFSAGATRILTYTDNDGLNGGPEGVATSTMTMVKDPADLISTEFTGIDPDYVPSKIMIKRDLTASDTGVTLDFSLEPADLIARANTIGGTVASSSFISSLISKNGTEMNFGSTGESYYLPPASKLIAGDFLKIESSAILNDGSSVIVTNIYDATAATDYSVTIEQLIDYSTISLNASSGVISGLSQVQSNATYPGGYYKVRFSQDPDGVVESGDEIEWNVISTAKWLGSEDTMSVPDLSNIGGYNAVSFVAGKSVSVIRPTVLFYGEGMSFEIDISGDLKSGDKEIRVVYDNALGVFTAP